MKTTRKTQPKGAWPVGLLKGQPYVPAAQTDLIRTFKRFGWQPPSELKLKEASHANS